MAYPKAGSRTHQILKLLHESGPQSYESIVQRFPTITRKSMGALGSEYKLPRVGAQFAISPELVKWFNGDAPEVKALGHIPVTHHPKPFKPLKGYDASMRLGRNLRDVSFMTASPSASNYWTK